MADVKIRVDLEGSDYAVERVKELGQQIAALEKQAQAPVKSLGDLDKAISSVLELQKVGAINSIEAERRAAALGEQYKHLTSDVLPNATKGLGDLGNALTAAALRASHLGAEKRTVEDFSEALGGVGGMSTKAALGLAALGVGAAVTVGVLVSKFKDAIEMTTSLGEQFHNLSQQTGISAEALSGKWRLAAETSNTTVEALAVGFSQFSRQVINASEGNKQAAETFERLNISVKDTNGNIRDSDTLMMEVAERFKNTSDGVLKTDTAMQLFGRSGRNLIPLLNEGAEGLSKLEKEARLLGITLSTETAKAANEFNSNMAVLKLNADGFWMEIASPIVEGLAKITTAFREARTAGTGFFSAVGQTAGGVATEEQERGNTIQVLQRLYEERARVMSQPGRGTGGQLKSIDDQIRFWEQDRDRLNSIIGLRNAPGMGGGGDTGIGNAGLGIGGAPERPDFSEDIRQLELREAAIKELAELQRQQGVIDNYQYEARVVAAKEEADLQKQHLKEREEAYRKLDTMMAGFHHAEIERNNRAAQSELRQVNETVFLFRDQKMKALEELRDKYEKAGESGKKALERINGELDALRSNTRATGVVVQDLGFDTNRMWASAHSSLEHYLGQIGRWALGLESSIHGIGDAIKGFFKSIVASIIDMMAKLAADEIFNFFRDLFRGGGSSRGGSFAGGAGGAAMNALLGGGIGGALAFGGGFATTAGASAGTAAALIESGTVGWAGAGMEAGALLGAGGALAGSGSVAAPIAAAGAAGAGLSGASLASMAGPLALGVLFATVLSGLFGGDDEVRGWRPIDPKEIWNPEAYVEPLKMFQTGGDSVVTRPTMFMAGETGPEEVSVRPLAAASRRGFSANYTFTGPVMFDDYTFRRFQRMFKSG